jgi:DNA-binding NtrC family response regulator
MVTTKKYTIMILDDEEDIQILYHDYLSGKGHRIIRTYANADTILQDIDIEPPDVYIIDYRLLGNMNGVEVAFEILKKFPSACIVFITAVELLDQEISKHDIFSEKNIRTLLKPVKLRHIQIYYKVCYAKVNLVNNLNRQGLPTSQITPAS